MWNNKGEKVNIRANDCTVPFCGQLRPHPTGHLRICGGWFTYQFLLVLGHGCLMEHEHPCCSRLCMSQRNPGAESERCTVLSCMPVWSWPLNKTWTERVRCSTEDVTFITWLRLTLAYQTFLMPGTDLCFTVFVLLLCNDQ
jgi:hypothetical protein